MIPLVQGGGTLPLTTTSEPPEARRSDGVTEDQEGRRRSGRVGERSREESDRWMVDAPPGPVHVAQLVRSEKGSMRWGQGRETHEHTTMDDDLESVAGQAAETPASDDTVQEYSRLVLKPLPNTVTCTAEAGTEEG